MCVCVCACVCVRVHVSVHVYMRVCVVYDLTIITLPKQTYFLWLFLFQIMLGLASHEPHFALLREEVRFGGKKDRNKRCCEILRACRIACVLRV